MNTEYEAKFLSIDVKKLRETLAACGATRVYPEFLMKRVVFDLPKKVVHGWARVRQEADKVTMSVKLFEGESMLDQKEVELTIDNFEQGVVFLEALGMIKKAYQESKRERWNFDGVDVTIDTWPGLSTFAEIEGDSEAVVHTASEQLGFDWSQAVFGAVSVIYERELGIREHGILDETPMITFAQPPVARE